MLNHNKTILIIDDEPATLISIADGLKDEGFSVLTAVDGETGLEIAKTNHPDLILLDILMPKIDGMMVLKRLREDSWGKQVPIILLTSLDSNDKIMEGVIKDYPSYYLLKKNWGLYDITQKIKECLKIQ